MNNISSATASKSFSTSRISTDVMNSNREMKTTQQKNTFLKPNPDAEATTYLSQKAKITAKPMKENIKISLDIIA
jgi:hypothetical protein